jgi:hypothetical protein
MDDRYADQLLDEVAAHLATLEADEIGELVRRLLVAVQPDGSWPEAELLREAVAACVDAVDHPDPVLDACREAISDPGLFADLLETLRQDLELPRPSVDLYPEL